MSKNTKDEIDDPHPKFLKLEINFTGPIRVSWGSDEPIRFPSVVLNLDWGCLAFEIAYNVCLFDQGENRSKTLSGSIVD